MKQVPDFDRFKAVLLRQENEKIPIAELYLDEGFRKKYLKKETPMNSTDDIEFYAIAGYDYYITDVHPWFPKKMEKTADGREFVSSQGFVSGWEDLETYNFPTMDMIDISHIPHVKRLLPGGMGLVVRTGHINFQDLQFVLGFENSCVSLFTQYDLVEEIANRAGNFYYQKVIRAIEAGADGIWLADDLAYCGGLVISLDHMRRLVIPWLKKMGDACRQANIPLILHSDGDISELIPDLVECGVWAIHPIEPKAMRLRDLKEKWGDRLSFIGGIDLDLLTRGEPQMIKKAVRENIEVAAGNGGYCVGSSNSVTKEVPIENYQAMIDTVKMLSG